MALIQCPNCGKEISDKSAELRLLRLHIFSRNKENMPRMRK